MPYGCNSTNRNPLNHNALTIRKNSLFHVLGKREWLGTLLAQAALKGERRERSTDTTQSPRTGSLTQGRGKEKEVMVYQREGQGVMVQATAVQVSGVRPSEQARFLNECF